LRRMFGWTDRELRDVGARSLTEISLILKALETKARLETGETGTL